MIRMGQPAAASNPSTATPAMIAQSITGRPYLSWTQVSSYQQCPRAFAFRYVGNAEPDFRENTLQDVITKLEPDLFRSVTGLSVQDFHLLVQLKVFNTEQMNAAVFAFRRYEDASLSYTGIPSHEGLSMRGGWDTVVAGE